MSVLSLGVYVGDLKLRSNIFGLIKISQSEMQKNKCFFNWGEFRLGLLSNIYEKFFSKAVIMGADLLPWFLRINTIFKFKPYLKCLS
jgi:hypothetical protein